jgi:hypothetical protein
MQLNNKSLNISKAKYKVRMMMGVRETEDEEGAWGGEKGKTDSLADSFPDRNVSKCNKWCSFIF